jgi:TRAP-type uncharacterized transport system substrate-binding protein
LRAIAAWSGIKSKFGLKIAGQLLQKQNTGATDEHRFGTNTGSGRTQVRELNVIAKSGMGGLVMLRACVCLAVIVAVAVLTSAADAAQFGTRDEAVAMVKRVQEKFKKEGASATFAAVTAQQHVFKDRDLYVYIMNFDCVIQAHAARAELVGKSLYEFRDTDGVFPARRTVEVARTTGHGWIDYRWTNPKTNLVEAKSTYVEKLGDGYAIGVGIYKDEQINRNTVSIISGSPGSDATYLQVAYDLAAVLNDGENLRILPVVGVGGSQNIRDVRALKGIDIGLTQVSILNNFRRVNETLGVPNDDKIVYVTKLFPLEAHLIGRPGINSIEQLKGQKVNLDELGSGTNYSMRDVFKRLGIEIQEVNLPQTLALEKVKTGEIAATVLVAGKPTLSMSRLRLSDGFKFVPIPYAKQLREDFLPSELTHDDYPDMVPAGQDVETIADSAVLIAYNWPKNSDRYRRVETFINTFFPRIAQFAQPPHHSKWREVNLGATLAGWTRLESAEAWLNGNGAKVAADERSRFKSFLTVHGSNSDRSPEAATQADRLYDDYLKWLRARGGTGATPSGAANGR